MPMPDEYIRPPNPGPVGNAIANLIGPPVLVCIAIGMGYLGGVFLVSTYCVVHESVVASVLIS